MSEIKVTFLGTGNAFCDGGRSHACIHVAAPGVSLLLDCGWSALPSIKKQTDPAAIRGIAVTHLHLDHYAGALLLVDEQERAGRTASLTIAGPAGLPERLRRVREALAPDLSAWQRLRYPLRLVTLSEDPIDVGGALVSGHRVRHSPEAEPHGLRVRVGKKLIAYSGDAAWSDELVRLAAGADLFVCEATNFSTRDPEHLSYREILERRSSLDCGRIVLTHLSEETLARLSELELEAAQESAELSV